MRKIIIFESTDILGYKIKKILALYNLENVIIVKDYSLNKFNAVNEFAGAACFLVDLDNRNQDAMQLIKYLKSVKMTARIPVVTLSGNASITLLKKAIKAGCTDFILKPFETETLINKIHKVCFIEENKREQEKEYHLGELFRDSAITLKWTKDFELGVEKIDLEHKNLIESYDKLYAMMRKGQGHEYYEELLEFLTKYVDTHFNHEEQLQLKVKFDQYEAHKELHDKFRARVEKIITDHKGEDISDSDLISISLFIKDWLLHHILIEDKKIKDFIIVEKKRGEA